MQFFDVAKIQPRTSRGAYLVFREISRFDDFIGNRR